MSYLSGYREQQPYENASSIPPFDVCVLTSPQPRVPSSSTPSILRHLHISSQRPCYLHPDHVASPFLEPFAVSHSLSIPGS